MSCLQPLEDLVLVPLHIVEWVLWIIALTSPELLEVNQAWRLRGVSGIESRPPLVLEVSSG